MAERMKRLFLAANIPHSVKERIFEHLSLKIPEKKCRVVKKENLHITMKFLGHLPEEAVDELVKKLKPLQKGKSFKAVLTGIGHFKGRVLWLGVGKGKKNLEEIGSEINGLLGTADERFSAHLTIARNRFLGRKEFDGLVRELTKKQLKEEVLIESIDLMESELQKSGPRYSVVEKIELQGSEPAKSPSV